MNLQLDTQVLEQLLLVSKEEQRLCFTPLPISYLQSLLPHGPPRPSGSYCPERSIHQGPPPMQLSQGSATKY